MTSGRFSTSLLPMLRQLLLLGRRHWWLSALLWIAMVSPAKAELELRVAIEQDVNQVRVGSSTKAVVRDTAGTPLGEIPAMGAYDAQAGNGGVTVDQWQAGAVWIEPTDGGYVFIGDRWYRGRTLVAPSTGGLTAINYVDLEQYLYSVLGSEMSGNWPQEALKAQAIAARSYALHKRQRSATPLYDLGDTTAWQVYEGIAKESPGTQAAVNATLGQVLTYGGQIIEAVFHSSSGGHTENVEDVWTSPLPYLRAVRDFDEGAPVYSWTQTFPADDLSNRISGVGNVLSMTPERTTPQGRIITMRVVGSAGSRVLSGNDIRRALGLKSTLFSVTPQLGRVASAGDVGSIPVAFQVNGRGYGHGLGMSQWGAYNMANQGYNYHQIVTHYYQGTVLSRIQVQ